MNHAQICFVMIVSTVVYPGHDAYRNLVVPGLTTTTQSSTYLDNAANRSVDGQPSELSLSSGSCSHTGQGRKEAWLWINLDKVYNVKEVKFWYRNDGRGNALETRRLLNYSMFYMNAVNNSWVRCYRDETPLGAPIPMPSIVPCKSKTASILFYTTQPSTSDKGQVFLEICEVKVYGCDVNQYGENCTDCSERCSECDVVSGCVSCYQQFTGRYCELCQPGYMGDRCAVGQKNYMCVDGRINIVFYATISIPAILLVISVSVNILMMRRKIKARNIRRTENTHTPKPTTIETYDNPIEVTDSTNYDILSFSGEKSAYTALETLQQKSH